MDEEQKKPWIEAPDKAGTAEENTETRLDGNKNGPAAVSKKKLSRLQSEAISYTLMLVAGFLGALAVHVFVAPNEFIQGGIAGLAVMLYHVTGLSTAMYLIVFNVPLIIIAFFFRGKIFALKTLLTVGSTALFIFILDTVDFPVFKAAEYSRLLAAIAGGVLGGVCMGVVLRCGSSNGGTDIIATLIHKKRADVNIAWFIFILDMTVVIAAAFVFNNRVESLILAACYMFVSAKACETLLEGLKSAIKFEIITTNPEEVANEIIIKLGRGVTLLKGTGMYSHTEKAVLLCVVRRRQITQLQSIIRRYPETFCYISATSDVMGRF